MRTNIKLLLFLILFISAYTFKPKLMGHRGGFKGVENTMECYKSGIEYYGYDGLECDVRVTLDKKFVISHNNIINGTKGEMEIEKTNLNDLKQNELTQERGGIVYKGYIATMEEYLSLCEEKHVIPVVELKETTGISDEDMSMFVDLLDLIKKHNLEKRSIFISFSKKKLEYVKTYYSHLRLQLIMDYLTDDNFEWCVKWGIDTLINPVGMSKEVIEKLHNNGIFSGCGRANDLKQYFKYATMGVYMINADYLPAKMMPQIKKRWPDIPDLDDDSIKFNAN